MVNSLAVVILAAMPTFIGPSRLLMLLPLVLTVAVVHKTLKQPRLKDVPLEVLKLWLTIVGAMVGLGVGLLLLYKIFS